MGVWNYVNICLGTFVSLRLFHFHHIDKRTQHRQDQQKHHWSAGSPGPRDKNYATFFCAQKICQFYAKRNKYMPKLCQFEINERPFAASPARLVCSSNLFFILNQVLRISNAQHSCINQRIWRWWCGDEVE